VFHFLAASALSSSAAASVASNAANAAYVEIHRLEGYAANASVSVAGLTGLAASNICVTGSDGSA
jgi:hypothetical protein